MKRIVVGISGASGSPLALRFLEALRAQDDVEIHLVVSDSALLTASYELPTQQGSADANPFKRFAHVYHEPTAFDASISSGSFEVDAMVIIPCSMKTVAGIASGYADNLLLRAADVTIKEKRPLILVEPDSPEEPELPFNAPHREHRAAAPYLLRRTNDRARYGRSPDRQDLLAAWTFL